MTTIKDLELRNLNDEFKISESYSNMVKENLRKNIGNRNEQIKTLKKVQKMGTKMTQLQNYFKKLKKMVNHPNQIAHYDWMSKHLKPMVCVELDGEDKVYVDKIIKEIRRGRRGFPKLKECFMNGMLLAISSDGRITYCEGQYLSIIPTEHGWCKINGKYFDPTQSWNGCDVSKNEYLGMEISNADITKYTAEDGGYWETIVWKMARKDIEKQLVRLTNGMS